jgi:hypothetical protein
MKHLSSILFAISLSVAQLATAQCTPDAVYVGAPAGIYPGISVNLPPVTVPEAYSAALTINTETDTAISVNVGPLPINAIAYISAMRINAVNGLPPGFIHSTDQLEWINGGAAPSFSQVQGCISIAADAASVQQILQDNPSGASFPLELVLDARIHSTSNALINGVVSNTWLSDLAATVPGTGAQIITGYVLTVEPDVTGLNEADNAKIMIYPNPANAFISIQALPGENGRFTISDISGRICLSGKLNGQSTAISVECLPAGVYVLQIEERAEWNQRIIKQ